MPPPPLSHAQSLVYASGNFAKNLLWTATEVALLFIFTDLFGLDPFVAGAVILSSLVWDALIDPYIGLLADRHRFGKLILVAAPVLALAFAVLMGGPNLGLHGAVAAALTLFAFRTAYSLVDVPHNALLGRITSDAAERGRLASIRLLFSSLASLAIGLTLPGILQMEDLGAAQRRLGAWAAVAGLLAAVILVAACRVVRARDTVPVRGRTDPRPPWTRIAALLADPRVRTVLILAAVGSVSTPVLSKTILYYATYVRGDPAFSDLILSALFLGQIAGVVFWIRASRRWDHHRTLALAHLIVAAAGLAVYALEGAAAPGLAAAAGLYGVGAAGVYAIIWAVTADAVDHFERRTGLRIDATIFAVVILVMQIGAGIGSGAIGGLLALSGYVAGGEQTAVVKETIRAVAGLLPVAGACAALVMLRRAAAGPAMPARPGAAS